MKILQISNSPSSVFSQLLEAHAAGQMWPLKIASYQTVIDNIPCDEAFDLIVFGLDDGLSCEDFLHWHKLYRLNCSQVPRYLVFSSCYSHHDAALLSGYNDSSYALFPDTADQLNHYLVEALGRDDDIENITLSSLGGALGQAVNQFSIVSIANVDGDIIYVNDFFCQVSGYSREELIGKNHSLLKSGYHDEIQYKGMWTKLNRGESWQGVFCNRNKQGDLYWVKSVIFPVNNQDNKPRLFVSIRVEITEQKLLEQELLETQKRYELSHAFANIGSWEWNITSGESYWSNEVHKLFGYDNPVLETTYDNFLEVIHPDDRELVVNRVEECISLEKPYSIEHRIVCPNGDVRWLSERGYVTKDDQGNVEKMLGIVADINDLKVAQQAAIEAEQLKTSFISMLSHEIRNPLSALLGYNQIIHSKSSDAGPMLFDSDLTTTDKIANKFVEISNFSEKNIAIINHLTSILDAVNLNTSLEYQATDTQIDNVYINQVIHESLDMINPEKHGITVRTEMIDYWVSADRNQIRQVFVNIFSNAVKYNKPKGEIYIFSEYVNDKTVRISIRDTGVGINTQQIDEVFKPYERLEWKHSEIEGLGLGLSICKRLVENMGGKIGLTSELGLGTTFWVELPKGNVITPQFSTIQTNIAPVYLADKILVLEDNEFNQEFIAIQLRQLGIECDITNNGYEALQLIKNNTYSGVLSDINMPHMNGLDFIKHLREDENPIVADLPVILVTAHNSSSQYYKDVKANNIIVKPFSINELAQKIRGSFIPFSGAQSSIVVQPPQLTVIDPALMKRYLGTDKKQITQLLTVYLTSLDDHVFNIVKSFEQADLSGVMKIAHKLSTSSLSIGARDFSETLRSIESAIKSNIIDKLEQYIDTIILLHKKLKVELEQLVSNQEEKQLITVIDGCEKIKILVIDDDDFTLLQIGENLKNSKEVDFCCLNSAQDAIDLIKNRYFDIVIFDINMPDIDGLQFIRLFSQYYSRQYLVIYSAETSLIGPLSDLIKGYKMNYLGVLKKPATQADLDVLLTDYKNFELSQEQPNSILTDQMIVDCVTQNNIVVMYQPQISTVDHRVVSVEALSRLVIDDVLIPPNNFIPRLAALNLEYDFAIHVSRQAIQQLAEWREHDVVINLAINFSMKALEALELPEQLREICRQYAIETHRVIIEITESVISSQPEYALEVISRLKLMGFVLSIDDFGTGYSSLDKLKKLPFSELKLDRSYVSAAKTDSTSMALLVSSLGLAKQLQMRTVAEGVEDKKDLEILTSLGATLIQGFYFSKPLNAVDVLIYIKDFNCEPTSC